MISVCMATYNGERYIKQQIDSILSQLGPEDELIISDDGSTDKTIEIIKSFKDRRIRFLSGISFHSPVYNFENALKHANGDIIFLSDQDDIWKPNRISITLAGFKDKKIDCLLCNKDIIDASGNVTDYQIYKADPIKKNLFEQLLHNPYIGCCMAFRRNLLELALPFPKNLPMHDSWIGLLGALTNSNCFIPKSLVLYRRHGRNVTTGKSPYSVLYRIKYRIRLYFLLRNRIIERRK